MEENRNPPNREAITNFIRTVSKVLLTKLIQPRLLIGIGFQYKIFSSAGCYTI